MRPVTQLPFVGCTAKYIRTVNDVLLRIASVCETTRFTTPHGDGTLELMPMFQPDRPTRFGGESFFVVPPCVVLVRHVERLVPKLLDRLRLASNGVDPSLFAEPWKADTSRVTWMFQCEKESDVPDEFDGYPVLSQRRP
jgi:hypothetical protein